MAPRAQSASPNSTDCHAVREAVDEDDGDVGLLAVGEQARRARLEDVALPGRVRIEALHRLVAGRRRIGAGAETGGAGGDEGEDEHQEAEAEGRPADDPQDTAPQGPPRPPACRRAHPRGIRLAGGRRGRLRWELAYTPNCALTLPLSTASRSAS